MVAGIIINLRHLLYGAVLNPHIKAKGMKKILISYLLTDEAFLITTLTQNQEQEKIEANEYNVDDILIGSGFTLWSMWNISTIIGYLSFSLIEDLPFTGEFIVASTFLGYFIMHWMSSPSGERLFVVVISILSVLLALMVQSSILIILLLIIGSFIAMIQKHIEISKIKEKMP